MPTPSSSQLVLRALLRAKGTRLVLMRKACSFALIGVINTVVDIVIFLTAYKILNLPLVPANLLAWMVAVSGSYVLNSLFTFAAESGGRLSLRFYVSFVASGVAGVISNTTTLWRFWLQSRSRRRSLWAQASC
jgi:putative flippase GtrA